MRLGLVLRWLVAVALVVPAPARPADAQPVLSCEQILGIVQEAARLRNEGTSLEQVLRGIRDLEAKHALPPLEAEALLTAARLVFLNDASPQQIAIECLKTRKKK